MRRTRALTMGLLLTLGAGLAGAEESNGLQLSVRSEKTTLAVSEPLVLDVELANKGATEALVVQHLDLIHAHYQYCVSTDGQTFRRIAPRIALDWAPPKRPLAAGGVVRHQQLLLYDGETDAAIFGKAGDYFVMVRDARLQSNTLKVRVEDPPERVRGMRSFTVLLEPRALQHLQWPLPREVIGALEPELERVAAENTVYAPYVACILGERQLQGEPPAEQTNKALGLLEKADVEGCPLRSKAVLLKATAYERLGQKDKAAAEFQRLEKQFPGSHATWKYRQAPGRTERTGP